jgi:hypothetical protein
VWGESVPQRVTPTGGQTPQRGIAVKRSLLALSLALSATLALGLSGPASAANPPEVGHFSGDDSSGPQVITDLPCLEGKEFIASGNVSFRGTFVDSEGFFHFSGIEHFSATLVPVDGQGPTYVESGNIDKVNFTARAVPAGDEIVQTRVNNDRFLGYVDGKLVASATIRIHEVQHFVALDTNGDDEPDVFRVSVDDHDLSCPA